MTIIKNYKSTKQKMYKKGKKKKRNDHLQYEVVDALFADSIPNVVLF